MTCEDRTHVTCILLNVEDNFEIKIHSVGSARTGQFSENKEQFCVLRAKDKAKQKCTGCSKFITNLVKRAGFSCPLRVRHRPICHDFENFRLTNHLNTSETRNFSEEKVASCVRIGHTRTVRMMSKLQTLHLYLYSLSTGGNLEKSTLVEDTDTR